jgi:hypothetical protein
VPQQLPRPLPTLATAADVQDHRVPGPPVFSQRLQWVSAWVQRRYFRRFWPIFGPKLFIF